MEKHNQRAALYQERMQAQRAAIACLKDGDIASAVRLQHRALGLTVQINQLTLELFLENTAAPKAPKGWDVAETAAS